MNKVQVSLPLYGFLLFSSLGFWMTWLTSILTEGSVASVTPLSFVDSSCVRASVQQQAVGNWSVAGVQQPVYDLIAATTSPGAAANPAAGLEFETGYNDLLTKGSTNELQGGRAAATMKLHDNFSTLKRFSAPERVWQALLKEGTVLISQNKKVGIIMEVGMHRATQCVEAAYAGFDAHCFEPSPISYSRVQRGVRNVKNASITDHIHIYNVAAGSKTNATISFLNSGSTGAFVVNNVTADMDVVKVPMMRLDDVVERAGSDVYMVKIDTQGFEPEVLAGLERSLKTHKVKYILMEYWPRGMDRMAAAKSEELCYVSVKVLQALALAGYTLFQLGVAFHPGEPMGDKQYHHFLAGRPFDDLHANCMWFYDLERTVPVPHVYHHGYWSDIFAVAPNSPLPENPVTAFGKTLKTLRNASMS
jgi:FkbM family methyltransferase